MTNEEENRVDAAALLPSLTFEPLDAEDAGATISYAFVLFKFHQQESPMDEQWAFRGSGSQSLEELLGVLRIQERLIEKKLLDAWEGE